MVSLKSRIRSSLGARLREARLYVERRSMPVGSPRLVIFPSSDDKDGSSNLRGYKIAEGLRRRGWRVVVCPHQFRLSQRLRLLRRENPDVLLIQKTYHPLNRASLYPGVAKVFDLDDADYFDPKHEGPIIDCCRNSAAVIVGSTMLRRWCAAHNPDTHVVWTGTPVSPAPPPLAERAPVVTWAASMPHGYPAEAEFLADVMTRLTASHEPVRFRIYADDGSEAYRALCDRFRATGVTLETMPMLPYPAFLKSLSEASVGLSPLIVTSEYSRGKSFGKVLGYLDQGVPTITHAEVDHPYFFRDGENGLLREGAAAWADAIGWLLDNPDEAQRIADQGRKDFIERLSIDKATDLVEGILRSAIKA